MGSSTVCQFFVWGLPQPAGSKRAFPIKRKDGTLGVAVSESNPNARAWKQEIAAEAVGAMNGRPPVEGPVELWVCFFLPRPAGHFNAKGVLRPSAPRYPTKRPDTLKLTRGLEDALTGIAWKDDSQGVTLRLLKRFAADGRPCTVVTVTELQGADVPAELRSTRVEVPDREC